MDHEDEFDAENEMEILHETGLSAASMIDAIMDEVAIFHEDTHQESDSDEYLTPTIPLGASTTASSSASNNPDMPGTSTEGAKSEEASSVPTKTVPAKTIPVDESLLTLLLKLYNRLSDKNAHYLLPKMRVGGSPGRRDEGATFVGGGVEYIQRLLDKVSVMHEGACKVLEEYSARHAPSGVRGSKSGVDTSEDR